MLLPMDRVIEDSRLAVAAMIQMQDEPSRASLLKTEEPPLRVSPRKIKSTRRTHKEKMKNELKQSALSQMQLTLELSPEGRKPRGGRKPSSFRSFESDSSPSIASPRDGRKPSSLRSLKSDSSISTASSRPRSKLSLLDQMVEISPPPIQEEEASRSRREGPARAISESNTSRRGSGSTTGSKSSESADSSKPERRRARSFSRSPKLKRNAKKPPSTTKSSEKPVLKGDAPPAPPTKRLSPISTDLRHTPAGPDVMPPPSRPTRSVSLIVSKSTMSRHLNRPPRQDAPPAPPTKRLSPIPTDLRHTPAGPDVMPPPFRPTRSVSLIVNKSAMSRHVTRPPRQLSGVVVVPAGARPSMGRKSMSQRFMSVSSRNMYSNSSPPQQEQEQEPEDASSPQPEEDEKIISSSDGKGLETPKRSGVRPSMGRKSLSQRFMSSVSSRNIYSNSSPPQQPEDASSPLAEEDEKIVNSSTNGKGLGTPKHSGARPSMGRKSLSQRFMSVSSRNIYSNSSPPQEQPEDASSSSQPPEEDEKIISSSNGKGLETPKRSKRILSGLRRSFSFSKKGPRRSKSDSKGSITPRRDLLSSFLNNPEKQQQPSTEQTVDTASITDHSYSSRNMLIDSPLPPQESSPIKLTRSNISFNLERFRAEVGGPGLAEEGSERLPIADPHWMAEVVNGSGSPSLGGHLEQMEQENEQAEKDIDEASDIISLPTDNVMLATCKVSRSKSTSKKLSKPRSMRRSSPNSKGQSVSFHSVIIREYGRCVGDNPAVSSGPPISLGWDYLPNREVPIDHYESDIRPPGPRTRKDFFLTPQKRFHILLDEWGFCVQEICRAKDEAAEIKYQRHQSFREGPLPMLSSESPKSSMIKKKKGSRSCGNSTKPARNTMPPPPPPPSPTQAQDRWKTSCPASPKAVMA